LVLTPRTLEDHLASLQACWLQYRQSGDFEGFVEFTLALHCLAEQMNRLHLPGLVRQCESLESAALSLFGDPESHPIPEQNQATLARQIDNLLGAIRTARNPAQTVAEHRNRHPGEPPEADWIKPRLVWMIVSSADSWVEGLVSQLGFYGFRVEVFAWGAALPTGVLPLAVIFVPEPNRDAVAEVEELEEIARVRRLCLAGQLFYLGAPRTLNVMVDLMRAGIDITVQKENQTAGLLSRILNLVQTQDQERYRVLVVEDSRVAAALIQRALSQHGIDSEFIADPTTLLEALEQYRPDVVLMDMYMPHCNGVEATRALRQLESYQATPIIYLSSETDVALQVEALRLGGDRFLTKPFNPVLLASTVRTTIERHREMQRASRHDGLTGLLNHTAVKTELDTLICSAPETPVTVAMIDIDHFKSINDTFGHPVGDQVIRSLAWLLRGRLRSSDLIGRYGGEEFLVALRAVDVDSAQTILQSILDTFSALPHAHEAGTLHATFSAGVAAWPHLDSSGDLVQAADNALLTAKRSGRNRVAAHPLGN
jgi:diguanylate cyclase (GGDEF)-like protein